MGLSGFNFTTTDLRDAFRDTLPDEELRSRTQRDERARMNHNAVVDAAQEIRRWLLLLLLLLLLVLRTRRCHTEASKGSWESVSHVAFSARKCDDLRQLTVMTVQ